MQFPSLTVINRPAHLVGTSAKALHLKMSDALPASDLQPQEGQSSRADSATNSQEDSQSTVRSIFNRLWAWRCTDGRHEAHVKSVCVQQSMLSAGNINVNGHNNQER